ncbi:MAG: hypothetical protein M3179_14370 [Actinomycetota bacterium]|nr:hypothetical protein [Actinomycetota bacterium]
MTTSRHRYSPRRPLAVVVLGAILGMTALQGVASAAASPTLSPYASSGWWAGTGIHDSVNVNNGVNPTGTLTFKLYGPDDQTCTAAPLFTTHKAVAGNGYYTSASFTTNRAGTYHWTVSYSGDANNNPVPPNDCTHEGQTVFVAKRNVTLSGAANPAAANGTITNTATLGLGVGPSGPTGTITFTLFGPDNMMCAGTPIFTSVKTVTANGTYASDPFAPTASGKYTWKLNYSGDANNTSAFTICSDTANHVSVTKGTTGFTFTASPTAVRGGDSVTVTWTDLPSAGSSDWIGFYAVGAPGWSLVAWSFTGGAASGSVTITVPVGTTPGSYEARLRTAKTNVVTVS